MQKVLRRFETEWLWKVAELEPKTFQVTCSASKLIEGKEEKSE